jgi:hypothetical protein
MKTRVPCFFQQTHAVAAIGEQGAGARTGGPAADHDDIPESGIRLARLFGVVGLKRFGHRFPLHADVGGAGHPRAALRRSDD